jgi:flagellar hook-basal body complex protein FliE
MIDLITPPVSSIAPASEAGPAELVRGAAAAATSASVEGADFGAMLGALASNAMGAVKQAETISMAGIRGQASVQQVVEAVMAAEQTLQSAIAIRDKVVAAYVEISRMSI